MTRITTIPPAEADDALRIAREAQHALYPPEYATPVPPLVDDAGGIVSAHSLIPDALYHAFATFGSLMAPDLPLDRRQQEMIATVVSATNRTYYCTVSHTEFLHRATDDEDLAEAIRRDFRTAPISDADRAMLEYAEQITLDATRVTDEHHARAAGGRLRRSRHPADHADRGVVQLHQPGRRRARVGTTPT